MNSATLSRDNIIDFIVDIFARRGADSYLGEEVTTSEHMLQAAQLAEAQNAPEAMAAAALLHDIGHYANEFPEDALLQGIDDRHEEAAAQALAPFFPPAVVEPVRLHVEAKRYLCAVDPGYFNRLSSASVHTLQLQGGPLNDTEIKAFEQNPYRDSAIQVRFWDEEAKVKGVVTPPFAHYVPLLRRLIETQ